MAEWSTPLPGEAGAGDTSHVEDHNRIVAALAEIRERIDSLEASKQRKRTAQR